MSPCNDPRIVDVSAVSVVDTPRADADTTRTSSGARPENNRRTRVVYTSNSTSRSCRRPLRRRRRVRARAQTHSVKCHLSSTVDNGAITRAQS